MNAEVGVLKIERHCEPSRAMALDRVAATSRFITSPNSYALLAPSVSTPVARWRLVRPQTGLADVPRGS